jgi:hypothetical protein
LNLDARLEDSLRFLAALLHGAEQPWWIIGSAAVALHGGQAGAVRDIDVVLGSTDAERYKGQLRLPNVGSSSDPLFRSDLLIRWSAAPLEIELMSGLKVNCAGLWRPLRIESREEVRSGLFVPSRGELRAILISFGRPKDLRRASALT